MKTKHLFLALPVIIIAALFSHAASSEPVVTDTMTIIQAFPLQGYVAASWQKSTVIGDKTYKEDAVRNTWPIGDTGTVSITLADGTPAVTTRQAVFVAVVAIATQEHAKP